MILTEHYKKSKLSEELTSALGQTQARIHVEGLRGSLAAVHFAALSQRFPNSNMMYVIDSKEDAYYLQNDIAALLDENEAAGDERRVVLFPTSSRREHADADETDNANVLMRAEIVKQMNAGRKLLVVTYPEALSEKVVSSRTLTKNTLQIVRGTKLDMDFVVDVLQDYDFERVDFVAQPGEYAVRGGIIDVFSFANDHPFRIEFFDDEIDSLRSFDCTTQLSIRQYERINIIPNLEQRHEVGTTTEEKVNLLEYFGQEDIVWVNGLMRISETIQNHYTKMVEQQRTQQQELAGRAHVVPLDATHTWSDANGFLKPLLACKIVETGSASYFTKALKIKANSEAQPLFNKQFELLKQSLSTHWERGYTLCISVANAQQHRRLDKIFAEGEQPWNARSGEPAAKASVAVKKAKPRSAEQIPPTLKTPTATPAEQESEQKLKAHEINYLECSLRNGFIDHDEQLLLFTDHEIFERYHKYTVRDLSQNREAMTLKELFELKPGDFVTHIDYGVGRFSGLEKIEVNGKKQEVIRLTYKNNDTLYISIHGLHKISRYVGKEGVAPTLNRLGSNTWQVLKQKTKKQVKDIAKDLIALYAKRKATRGFAFSADSYLQHELEASFMYEDTPDQLKATVDVKGDMESEAPMDRLVCGDVGFGKTEVAIRAAFKAVADSKQVAVLVPSTILAFQHYNTFCDRLQGMPVNIDYLNRFRTTKEKNRIYKEVESGKIDILIGTHAITNSNLKFKDLGLLIIDEEQKFGVSVKEKLKQMRANVDCLTLTATPIPRTLQFSLMGARDLSIIQTPPPNRQPIQTELTPFSEEVIRDAIMFEMSRYGQTFFISNRVENLDEMAALVQRLVPDARVAVAHGQMDGKEVERTLMRFIEGELDVLVATAIIENGLDIPNANTMIINNAQQFGLSDLHQMRGRVGRSNKKAFCYMMVPSFTSLTDEAQKRLRAIEEFASVGSGFNIAMRDLDIRGAGNILGAEQSGFISEIGYDMYHKILNEAIEELKESDFKDLFEQERNESNEYVKECAIETDLEVLLPDDYVTSISERLLLYKELNELSDDAQLDAYRERLIDRFGPIPIATQELIKTITLRRMAKEFGIERLVLKQGKMVCFFVSNPSNPFYQSPNFMRMIQYAQQHQRSVHLKESTDRLSLTCDHVESISEAIDKIRLLTGLETIQQQ
ncbi:MAG: transcription-repair coupling factor [Bacteroidales bacterium]|nr:transcription-repair coupling factor [Bacteroidales bacterium]